MVTAKARITEVGDFVSEDSPGGKRDGDGRKES